MTMRWSSLAAALLLVSWAMPAAAAPPAGKAGGGSRGTEKVLTLHAKNPETWQIVPGGASGTLTYVEAAGTFAFTGRQLSPDTEYVLVRHADAPPAGEIVARGRSDRSGHLRLNGRWHDWAGKFWLVPGSDVAVAAGAHAGPQPGRLIAWHPERYLFEYKILGIPCDCEDL